MTYLGGMVNGRWLDAQQFPDLEFAVPGIVPEGFGLLVAPPKAGKSWFVGNVGLACASGGLALGRIKVEQRDVLYLALEDGHRRLQSRFRRIMVGDAIPERINVITEARGGESVTMIEEFISKHPHPLIVLDTLGKVKPQRASGADAYQADYDIGSRLKGCIDASPGGSLVVVHHTRKAESADFVDSVSGTAGIAGSADFVLMLSRKRHSDEATLSVTGRDISEAEYALRCDEGLWLLDGDGLAASARMAEQRRVRGQRSDRTMEILAVVQSSVEPVTAADVAEKLGLDGNTVGTYLRRLVEDDRLAKVGRGRYISAYEPFESLEPAVQDGVGGV